MSGKRQARLGRLNEQLPRKTSWARFVFRIWLRKHAPWCSYCCWFTPLTWIITSWYKLYVYLCNSLRMFFLSSWQSPSSFLMFFKVFSQLPPNIKLEFCQIRGTDQAGKLGVPLRSSCCSYGHFTIFHSLNMIEVGQLKMLKCDVLVFYFWCFFFEGLVEMTIFGKAKKKSANFRGATSSRLPGSLLEAFC